MVNLRVALAGCVLVWAWFPTCDAASELNGTLPSPLPLLPADNWWNADVTQAPVQAGGGAFLQVIQNSSANYLRAEFGPDPAHGLPYVVVEGSQALRPVSFDLPDISDVGATDRPEGYPIPDEAITQVGWIEGGFPGNVQDFGSDRHMLIVDRDNRILFELIGLQWDSMLSRWRASSGVTFRLDYNDRRPEGQSSAISSGLAALPGLVRYDEVASGGPIRHALSCALGKTNGYVYPASAAPLSSVDPDGLPLGARLRLKPEMDLSGYDMKARAILQAMKTYGLIVAERGANLLVFGASDPRWGDITPIETAFQSIHATDFEVIELGWRPRTRAGRGWAAYR